jgi:signal recognition particle GTPase
MGLSIDEYLRRIERFVDDPYGRQFRSRFADGCGSSELAMLQSPSRDEWRQMAQAVAMMTPAEKAAADRLTDQEVRRIADDAGVDPAVVAIFMNGYALECQRVS